MPSRLPPKVRTLLAATLRFSRQKKIPLYIVGGFVRDMLLGRAKENPDVDFAIPSGAIAFGSALAQQLKCGFVVLDEEHGSCRLVKKTRPGMITLDFTDFRGRDLKEDLRHRDFTVNSLAVELTGAFFRQPLARLIDPFGGKKDLARATLRCADPAAFTDDPLRILRAFSLSCVFGCSISPAALALIKPAREKLGGVSFERIRDELFKILDCPAGYAALLEMDRRGILEIILPEIGQMRGVEQGPYHHLDVWRHSLETVRQMEELLRQTRRQRRMQEYLAQELSSGRKRRSLLKLGALLHDIGKPQARRRREGKTIFHGHERIGLSFIDRICERLRLSGDEQEALRKMVMWHLRPGYLGDSETVSPRAQFRYFRDTGAEGVSILLLSMADQRSTRGPLTSRASRMQHERVCLKLIREFFRREKEVPAVRLITGDDLIRRFRLPPSPLIGKVLKEIEELQAIGSLKNKAGALAAAQKIIAKEKKK